MVQQEVSEEQYAAAIPACCEYQGLEAHIHGLGLCWGLMRAIERGEKMDCSGCELATRAVLTEPAQCDRST